MAKRADDELGVKEALVAILHEKQRDVSDAVLCAVDVHVGVRC